MHAHVNLRSGRTGRHQGGFSFVELAIVMTVVGLMGWAVSAAYGNTGMVRERNQAVQLGESLKAAVRGFALVNARLPCPDTDGDGWEGGPSGVCGPGDQTGWFPYHSMGMDQPEMLYRVAYAVYRRPGNTPASDADLVMRIDRTGDSPGDPHFQDARDLIVALNNAGADLPSTTKARLTGNDGSEGPADCTQNVRSHPAFFVIFPLVDRSGDGNRFDGPHDLAIACAMTPGVGVTLVRDDVVVAESLATLAGWLGARAP